MKRLALALFLSGCGGGGGLGGFINQTLGPDCTSTPQNADGIAVVGRPTLVRLQIMTRCTRSAPLRDTTVEITVTGPADESVAHTASDLTHDQVFQNGVEVTFTPTSPGPWVVTANFPRAGTARATLRAVPAWVEPGTVATWDEIRRCSRFTFTSHGTLSCVNQTTWRGPVELRSQRGDALSGLAIASTGDTLWWLTKEGTLERRVDNGALWAVTHQLPVMGASGPLAVDGDDVWFPNGKGQLAKAHPEPDGTLSLTTLPLPEKTDVSALAAGPAGLMIWSDNQSAGPTMTAVSLAGKATTRSMAAPNGWGFLQGVDGDTLWVVRRSGTRNQLLAFRPSAEGMSEAATDLPLEGGGGGAEPLLAAFHWALWVGAGTIDQRAYDPASVVPRLEAGEIVLDAFVPGDGYQEVGIVSPDHLFAQSKDNASLKIFRRPR